MNGDNFVAFQRAMLDMITYRKSEQSILWKKLFPFSKNSNAPAFHRYAIEVGDSSVDSEELVEWQDAFDDSDSQGNG